MWNKIRYDKRHVHARKNCNEGVNSLHDAARVCLRSRLVIFDLVYNHFKILENATVCLNRINKYC